MSLFIRFLLLIAALLWVSGIFILFFVPFWDSLLNFYPLLNLFYSRVCHQIPNKLIYSQDAHTLVCARCSGIYTGSLAASIYLFIFFSEFRISTRVLILSGIPLLADVLFYSLGVYQYSHYIAFFTGTLFGTICFFYIFQGLNLLISELRPGN